MIFLERIPCITGIVNTKLNKCCSKTRNKYDDKRNPYLL